MRNLFDEFKNLWPATSHAAFKPILSSVSFLYFPADLNKLKFINNRQKVIIVINSATLNDIVGLLSMGFEHIVQNNRVDFAQELLVSGLMACRPESFTKNPIPFFFGGFLEPNFSERSDLHFMTNISKKADKDHTIESLHSFLQEKKKMMRIKDLIIQIADELIANAISSEFATNTNAPNITTLKEDTVFSKPVKFFCCHNNSRIIIGCEDQNGTFKKPSFLSFLRRIFSSTMVKANSDESRGAGFGFKYIIENSANIYLYTDENVSSLVACGLSLNGIKENVADSKNFHFSFK